MTMSAADQTELVKRYWDALWLGRNLDALDDILADPMIRHTEAGTSTIALADFKKRLGSALSAVRACDLEFGSLRSDGEHVWARIRLDSINLTTELSVSSNYLCEYRIENDRIAEVWQTRNASSW